MQYIYTVEHHSAIKKDGVLTLSTTGWALKMFMQSEKKPDTKDHILYDAIYMKYPEKAIL